MRRSITCWLLGLALFLTPLACAGAALAAGAADVPDLRTRTDGVDWPQFLGSNRDNKSPETGILKKWPESGPPIAWHRPLGEGYGAASISKGRLFVFDRDGKNNRLTCMTSETGKDLWQFEYPTDFKDMLGYSGGPRCAPLVDDDRVYIVGGEGVMHCLRVTDGKVLWKLDTVKQFNIVKNFFGTGSSPIIEGDLLITQVGGSPPGEADNLYAAAGDVKPNGTGVVAFNKLTGKVVYKITDELASYSSPVVRTIDNRRWCFVFARGGLVGFEPTTGKIDFHYPWRAEKLESVNASNPVVVNDMVFISETYGPGSSLLKVKPGGYDVVWDDSKEFGRGKAMQAHWNTPIYVDGYLYGCSGRHSGGAELRCIEYKTGQVAWSQVINQRSSLLYADGYFIALSEFGQLILFKADPQKFEPASVAIPTVKDPVSGDERRLLEYPAWAAPVLSHGLLYVRGKDQLVCMELIPPKNP